MSKPDPTPGNVFNVETVRSLVELMKQHELSEIDLREGDQKIHLKRGGATPTYLAPPPGLAPLPGLAPPPAPLPMSAPAASPAPDSAGDSHLVSIKSPMVGTYYSRPKPESEPFVRVGDHISEDTVICIIEAMKVFNEIKAEAAGKVVKITVKNEEPVEFGQVLIQIDPNA